MANSTGTNPIIFDTTGAVTLGKKLVKSILFVSDDAGYGKITDNNSKDVVKLKVDGTTKFNEAISFGDVGTLIDINSVTISGTNAVLWVYL